MKKIWSLLENKINDCSVKKKLILFYIICVLIPLFITDSIIVGVIFHGEQKEKEHELESIASAVESELVFNLDESAKVANMLYLNRSVNKFLDKEYESALEFYIASLEIEDKTFYEVSGGAGSTTKILMYSDNETIVNGDHFFRLSSVKNKDWYQQLQNEDEDMLLQFEFIGEDNPTANILRRISIFRKMDYFKDLKCEKLVRLDLDYSNIVRKLINMRYSVPVYICSDGKILCSNVGHSGTKSDFESLTGEEKIAYQTEFTKYGKTIQILIMETESNVLETVKQYIPLILILLLIDILFPGVMMVVFNRSIVSRLTELGNVFEQVEAESLKELENVRGRDEIGTLMYNYNRMVYRFRELIRVVYTDKLEKQKMDIARQNAELLALHSQINPHFLFNVLEGIRMHSVLKGEEETAKMIEQLALLERENANWQKDMVLIREELKFIEAYLELQKHRFGERLQYKLEIEEDCLDFYLPKLTLVTFVENACVHGVEKKTAACWIYVRIYQKNNFLYLEIEDTGIGIDETKLEELREKMKADTIEAVRRDKHIGIANACLRLRMVTNQSVEFELDSEPKAGTFILIRIPLDSLQYGGEKE